jgi:hypothetical protein
MPFFKGIDMKIADKLEKVGEDISIKMYDNGFMVEISGRDSDDDWADVKIVCNTLDEVKDLISEASEMPRS